MTSAHEKPLVETHCVCRNCSNYRWEWCKKVLDSPDPDLERECKYFESVSETTTHVSMISTHDIVVKKVTWHLEVYPDGSTYIIELDELSGNREKYRLVVKNGGEIHAVKAE